jgi:hypothetical protein
MTLLCMIPHRARVSRDPLNTIFPCPVHTSTNVNFIGSGEACFKPTSRVWHTSDNFFFWVKSCPFALRNFSEVAGVNTL